MAARDAVGPITNSFVVMDLADDHSFHLQLRDRSPSLRLNSEMSLKEVSQQLMAQGEAKQTVEFFAPDGSRYASSSMLKHIVQMPYFKLNFDSQVEYHIHSKKDFGEPVGALSPSERTLFN